MTRIHLPPAAQDVLREIGNIGSAHAATALSTILDHRVDMNVPLVELVEFDHVADLVGGPEEVVACVFLRVEGELSGNLFLILSISAAKRLIANLLPAVDEEAPFAAMEVSALAEIGNIMAGSYLSSLATLTKLKLSPSVPSTAFDMAQSLLTIGFLTGAESRGYAMIIHTQLASSLKDDHAHIFFLPDPGEENILLHALGVEVEP
ncbi:chemotaxis protein CheC [Ferroacidibacillus organovorans]|uniref:CheC-like protein domain-containing protein n=1 Tax=Ferroacidibacillus organovorans TaxID=1765683 RepID=A0A101XPG8_9BACL|nr:chemotaxis protein CheC [Ferroacidibacillus organovorans]KUO95049.1 hypothetical protein ATW55_11265 [Ferroacidibacillus organovorans]